MQTCTHTRTCTHGGTEGCVLARHSGVACLLDTREREGEMAFLISPSLPFFFFFFASDSKMDDCNHRNHQ